MKALKRFIKIIWITIGICILLILSCSLLILIIPTICTIFTDTDKPWDITENVCQFLLCVDQHYMD